MKKYNLVIIGAGPAGLSAAYEAYKAGERWYFKSMYP